jgi:hypothetical protein
VNTLKPKKDMASKFIEYLRLLPKGLANIDKVAEGWINDVKLEKGKLSDGQAEEIVRRRIICNGCPFMSENMKGTPGFNTRRNEPFCTVCGCPIKAKTASLSSNCGIEDWDEQKNPLVPDIKWTAYDGV